MSVLVAATIFHCTFFIVLIVLWRRISTTEMKEIRLPVSVIVPVRNEEKSISDLIVSLEKQEYPRDLLEIIVIDDHSQDHTVELAKRSISQSSMHIRLFELPADHKGKKKASSLGVSEAKHDLILCTDADCLHPPNWVAHHVSMYSKEEIMMVSGPVKIKSSSWFQHLQAIEFNALIVYGAITLSRKLPGMCNGANMSYRKKAFIEVGGYEGNENVPTGDDEFLMQKIFKQFRGGIDFIKSSDAIVQTVPKESLSSLISQRIRWTSKWKFHKSSFIRISAVLGFFDFVIGFLLLGLLFVQDNRVIIGILVISRWVSEWVYLVVSARFSKISVPFYIYPMVSVIYPLYAVFLGFASIFGNYSWKGRKYT